MKPSTKHLPERCRWLRCAWLAGLAWLCLLLLPCAFALDPARSLTQYNCQTWSRRNGLPANGINAIAQTKDGYLWFGTAAGVLRFDGVEFKLFDPHSVAAVRTTIVTSLASARSGGLWVGLGSSAFGFYDGRSFSFRGGTDTETTWLDVRSILEAKDGTVWLAAAEEVARLNRSGGLEPVLTNGSDTNIALNVTCGNEGQHGRLWFGTANQGVYCWQDGRITKIPDSRLDGTSVHCIAERPDGQIWVGTSIGLYCYDAGLQRQEIPALVDEVRALFVDREGALWIGTSGRGLARYQQGSYDFLQKTDGLGSDYVSAIAEDNEGSLWVGTRDGISQISDVKFPIQQAAEDPKVRDALAVSPSKLGGVWIASSLGVTRFDPKTKSYTTLPSLPDPYTKRAFEAVGGDVYAVNKIRNLMVFSGGKVVATNAAPNMIVGLAEDEQSVVVSVGGDLYRAGTNYFLPYAFTNAEKPPFYFIYNLASGRDGVIWVASVNGIFRVKDGAYRHWAAAEGLSDLSVAWICEDQDGVAWAGLLSGIARVKDNQIRLIKRKDGLFDDSIYSIVPDDLGNLWVDSGRGIFRVTRRIMNDFADGKTARVEYTVFDGVNSVKIMDKTEQERSGCKTADGRIWFPSPLGAVMIDPTNILTSRLAPPVHIERVLAKGGELALSENITVPPGKGELEFHYNALSFITPPKVQFRYRLEGYDENWVDAGGRRMAFYTNLKPGHYTFCVIAANADGVWNRQGDAINIELRPHYYQTDWFYLLCGVLALAALGGIYAWRVRHLRSKQQNLQRTRELLETEVAGRTRELATANASLQREEAQLKQKTQALEKEIEERKRMELENKRIHRELLETSRQAGMAEIATNVLHNIGNVLNSVNVSASLVVDNVKQSKAANLARVAAMLREHEHDLGTYITSDAKGRQLPAYLGQLSEQLLTGQQAVVHELDLLVKNVDHIKEVVTMQQSYARVSAVREIINLRELVEDSLRMNEGALNRHQVEVVREFENVPPMNIEKHKVLQVLMNLIRNARRACDESGRADKQITVRVTDGDGGVTVSVSDNGIGIPIENLTRIFSHGFTTSKDGHGFGLHSGALAAKEMGGSLKVHSDGPGRGATFTLELPCTTNRSSNE